MRTVAALFGCLLFLCNRPAKKEISTRDHTIVRGQPATNEMQAGTIKDISVPPGTKRVDISGNGFAGWLRRLSLQKDNRVFLYDNSLKPDQSHHYAVIDISRGNRDLQQCADAIMRMRAEFFYGQKRYESISFMSGKTMMSFSEYRSGYRYYLAGNQLAARLTAASLCENRKCFMEYMETVFAFSGTYNLFDQLKPRSLEDMQPGDVFIKAGSPGHAMIVVDMARSITTGKKYFMLAQGFMPAQDIHIVVNPADRKNPWFELDATRSIVTPDWTFTPSQLRCW